MQKTPEAAKEKEFQSVKAAPDVVDEVKDAIGLECLSTNKIT